MRRVVKTNFRLRATTECHPIKTPVFAFGLGTNDQDQVSHQDTYNVPFQIMTSLANKMTSREIHTYNPSALKQ